MTQNNPTQIMSLNAFECSSAFHFQPFYVHGETREKKKSHLLESKTTTANFQVTIDFVIANQENCIIIWTVCNQNFLLHDRTKQPTFQRTRQPGNKKTKLPDDKKGHYDLLHSLIQKDEKIVIENNSITPGTPVN
jgi:hypothetical protein